LSHKASGAMPSTVRSTETRRRVVSTLMRALPVAAEPVGSPPYLPSRTAWNVRVFASDGAAANEAVRAKNVAAAALYLSIQLPPLSRVETGRRAGQCKAAAEVRSRDPRS
jgi:hypothetical protein